VVSERIERRRAQLLEVSNVALDHDEPAHDSHCGNQASRGKASDRRCISLAHSRKAAAFTAST